MKNVLHNVIRERARGIETDVLPDITASGTELWTIIINERRVELVFEEYRLGDVLRWKIVDNTENIICRKIYTIESLQERKFHSQHYLLPIPRDEMNNDPNLEQNPAYN